MLLLQEWPLKVDGWFFRNPIIGIFDVSNKSYQIPVCIPFSNPG